MFFRLFSFLLKISSYFSSFSEMNVNSVAYSRIFLLYSSRIRWKQNCAYPKEFTSKFDFFFEMNSSILLFRQSSLS